MCVTRFRPAASRSSLLVLGVLAIGLCACGDDDVGEVLPKLRVSPTTLVFDDVSIGAEKTASLTIINDGNAPLDFEAVPFGQHTLGVFSVVDQGEFPLAGGDFTSLTVRFAPVAEQEFVGTIVLPFEQPIGTAIVPVEGVGRPPPIALSPAAIDFGSIDAGQFLEEIVTVTNESDERLTFNLSLASPAYTVSGQLSTSMTLEPRATNTLPVRFTPPGAGQFGGRLIAEVCGPRCGPGVDLVGEGKAPRISASPRPVDFGAVSVGAVGEQALELSNQGVGTLVITRIVVEDPLGAASLDAAFDLTALPLELSPSDVVTLPLRYGPTAPDGEFRATLVVDSNDPLSPRVAIPMTATTPGAALRVLPAALHFGRLDVGAERLLDAVLLSTGTDVVNLEAIRIEGAAAGAFEIAGFLPIFPLEMAPSESLLLSIRATGRSVDATNSGAFASLVVVAGSEQTEVPMTFASGNAGCQPRVAPGNLAFGNMRVGQGANGRSEIVNDGTEACTLVRASPAAGLPFDPGFVFQALQLESLAPGQAGAVQFAYQASVAGPASAVLAIEFAEQPAPLFVSASARGVLGGLVAEPPTVSIGPTLEGCVEGTALVSFVNDGAGPVRISSLTLDPPQGPISIDSSFATTRAQNGLLDILPGAILEVQLSARPNASAGTHVVTVRVDSDDVGLVTARAELVVETAGARVTEQFTAANSRDPALDILFVVDNSGSMGDDQQILADNFDRFVESAFLSAPGSDVHLGVTTTDLFFSNGSAAGMLVGSPPYLTSSTGGLSALFQQRALVGVDGAGTELGLEAMRMALDGRNSGFLRPNAALSIVIVSDEDDSGPQLGPPYERSPESYIQTLQSLKAGQFSGAPVLVSIVVYPNSSPRYRTVAEAFNGVILDISSENWGEGLGEIGAASLELSRIFRLENFPDPNSIVVTVDGVTTTDYALSADGRSIILNTEAAEGAVVEIDYAVICGAP